MDNSNQEVPNSITHFDQKSMPVGSGHNHTAKTIDGDIVVSPTSATRTTVQQVENVSIGGVEMPIATAYSMGLIENPNQTGGRIVERTETIASPAEMWLAEGGRMRVHLLP